MEFCSHQNGAVPKPGCTDSEASKNSFHSFLLPLKPSPDSRVRMMRKRETEKLEPLVREREVDKGMILPERKEEKTGQEVAISVWSDRSASLR